MKTKNNFEKKGFTMMEMLIVSVICVIFVTAIFSVLVSGRRLYSIEETRMDLQLEARKIMRRLVEELSCAAYANITINETQDAITFFVPRSYNYTTGKIEWQGPIQFFWEEGDQKRLVRMEENNTEVIGENVAFVQFKLNGSVVGIRLTLEKRASSRENLQIHLDSQLNLRN